MFYYYRASPDFPVSMSLMLAAQVWFLQSSNLQIIVNILYARQNHILTRCFSQHPPKTNPSSYDSNARRNEYLFHRISPISLFFSMNKSKAQLNLP